MTEQIQSAKIICQGGLNTNQNFIDMSDTQPGAAVSLINYETSLYGGYRRINGYFPLEEEFPEVDPLNTEGKILGIAIFNEQIIVARKQVDSNNYKFYYWTPGQDWTAYDTGTLRDSTGIDRIRYDTFNFDGTEKIIFVDGVNPGILFDGTEWSEIKSTNSGAIYRLAGGNQVIDKPKYVTVFKNHIFMAGEQITVHSAPNSEYDWTAASGAGQIPCGFEINQIKPWRDFNYVFGKNRIKYVTVEGTDFVLKDVTTDIGCVASDSVLEIGGDLVFLSQDGIRPISGTNKISDVELETISKNIQLDLISLVSTYPGEQVCGTVIRRKSQIRLFFSSEGVNNTDSEGIIGGLRGNINGISWEWGRLKGIRAACVTSAYIGNVEFVVHGDFDGKVYRQEVGNTFDGEKIPDEFSMTYLDFGDTQIRKTMRAINLFVRPEGPLTINAKISYDWGLPNQINPDQYTLLEEQNLPIYGTAIYDDPEARYTASSIPVKVTNIEGSGRSVQATFSISTKSAYSLQGVVFEFSTDGRQ